MSRPNKMFQYLFWPEEWAREATAQLKRAQGQVQLLMQASDFGWLEEMHFRLVNKGVYLEVCLREHPTDKSLRYVNAKKRLVLAGAEVCVHPRYSLEDPAESFLIIDRRHLISDTRYQTHDDHRGILIERTRHFHSLMASGHRENPAKDDLRIRLWSSAPEVPAGQAVDIYWEVENADFIEMEPGVGAIASSGSLPMTIFEDTLFRVKAGNRGGMLMRPLIVLISEPSLLEVTVSVLDAGSGIHIPLESASETTRSYAVLRGDRIRVSWRTPVSAQLQEKRLGRLPAEGKRDMEVSVDQIFVFTLRTTYEEAVTQVSVVVMDEPSYLPQLARKATARPAAQGFSLRRWLRVWVRRLKRLIYT